MLTNFHGKNAVVVGGGSGIGRGIALALSKEGANVLVADIDGDTAAAVKAEIEAAGGTGLSARVDATSDGSLAALAATAQARMGDINLLVHTPGVISHASASQSSDDTWGWSIEFNLMAAVRDVRAFLPFLRSHDGDRHIVITASTAGLMSIPPELAGGLDIGVYTVSKHAALAYGEMLRSELTPEGINVSTLCPGVVNTNLDATSAKNRPARFGGPMGEPKELDLPERMAPEAVGPIVIRGIRANRAYIFTHPELLEMIQQFKIRPILEDFAFFDAGDR